MKAIRLVASTLLCVLILSTWPLPSMAIQSTPPKMDDFAAKKLSDYVSVFGKITDGAKTFRQPDDSNWFCVQTVGGLAAYDFSFDPKLIPPRREGGYDIVYGGFNYGKVIIIPDQLDEGYDVDYVVEEEPGDEGPSRVTHSNTNAQVEGVDEADVIKTDGRYIFYLSRQKGIAIINATDKPVQVATLLPIGSYGETPQYIDMYISGDKLVVSANATAQLDDSEKAITRYYVYNIADASKPKLVRTVELEGKMQSSRLINNTVYTVTSTAYPGLQRYDQPIASLLKFFKDTAIDDERHVISPENTYLWTGRKQTNAFILAAFSLDDDVPVEPQIYVAPKDGAIYMNRESMYITGKVTRQNTDDESYKTYIESMKYAAPSFENGQDSTYFFRFDLEKHGMKYTTTFNLPGILINRYAMDEYEGDFRVVMTNLIANANGYFQENFYGDRNLENKLYLIDKKTAKVTGKLNNIGNKESLKSVRFRGKTAYAVTFKITDPLFVIDLANPQKPEIAGELKIPGFSAYLHPYKDDYLIGVGREIDDYYGSDLGLKLSLFDISNPKKIVEVDKLVLPGSLTVTNATDDPRAFMFDLDRNIMAFPIEYTFRPDDWIYEYLGMDEQFMEKEAWSGGIVIELSETNLTVAKKMKLSNAYMSGFGTRFVYIGDTLYYVNEKNLVAMNYTTFEEKSTLPLNFSAK